MSDYASARKLSAEQRGGLDATAGSDHNSAGKELPCDPLATTGIPNCDVQTVGAPDDSDRTVAERIWNYRIENPVEDCLGAGSFGTVYRAYDECNKRYVAIKVLHFQTGLSSQEAMSREVDKLIHLEHPGIIPVYGFGHTMKGQCFVVSELMQGGSLEQRIKTERLSRTEAVEIVTSVAEALHYAHQRGLVHRDVKPANILLNPEGKPLLADFGLALHEDEQRKRRDEIAGSPAYMAPEQVRGQAHHLDGRADIWALGIILYELLTGKRPFGGSPRNVLFDEILHREPKPLRVIDESIPEELERITLKCLRKDVADRYSTAVDLASDLRKWAGKSEASQPTVTTPKTKSRKLLAIRFQTLGCSVCLSIGVLTVLLVASPWLFVGSWRSMMSGTPVSDPSPADPLDGITDSRPKALHEILTEQAWEAFRQDDFEKALEHAQGCIREFAARADDIQQQLEIEGAEIPEGKVTNSVAKRIFENGLLNDVGTCYWIAGRCLEKRRQIDEAKKRYGDGAKLTYARCWDPNAQTFWSTAVKCQDDLDYLNESAETE